MFFYVFNNYINVKFSSIGIQTFLYLTIKSTIYNVCVAQLFTVHHMLHIIIVNPLHGPLLIGQ